MMNNDNPVDRYWAGTGKLDMDLKFNYPPTGWNGFWIGLGIVIAAMIIKFG